MGKTRKREQYLCLDCLLLEVDVLASSSQKDETQVLGMILEQLRNKKSSSLVQFEYEPRGTIRKTVLVHLFNPVAGKRQCDLLPNQFSRRD